MRIGPFSRVGGRLAELVFLVGLLGLLWHVGAALSGISPLVLPTPAEVALRMAEAFPLLLRHALATLQIVVLGFLLAVAAALPLAVLVSTSPVAEKVVLPLTVVMRTLPTVSIAPLIILVFGFGLVPKLLIVLLIAFFPILVNSVTGFKGMPLELIQLLRSMGASRLQVFRTTELPNALPQIIAGLKLGLTLSLTGAIVAEFLGSSQGIGYLVLISMSQDDTPLVYGGITTTIILGALLFASMSTMERLLIPWHVSQRRTAD